MNTVFARLGVVASDFAPLVAILTKLTLVLAVAWLFHAALGRSNPRWRVLVWRLSASAIGLLGGLALAPPFLHLAILPSATPRALPATESAAKTPATGTGTGAQQRSADITASADPAAQTNLLERRSTLTVDGPAAVKNSVCTALPGGTASPQIADRPRADAVRAIASSVAVSVPSNAIPRPSSVRVEKRTNDRVQERAFAGWLFAIWFAGAAGVALRAVVGLFELRRIRRSAVPVPDGVRAVAERVAGTLGVVRPFKLCQTRELQTPCVVGVLRPMILLPERQCLPQLRDELPAILAHEVAHLKGGDLFWNSLLHAQSLALWFHPLAWRIRLAHADACDAVCDALATDYVGDAGLYGRILARLTLRINGAKASPGLAMARVSSIERRIAALHRHVFRAALSRRRALCAVSLSTAAIAALGGLVLAPSQAQTPKAPPLPTAAQQAPASSVQSKASTPSKSPTKAAQSRLTIRVTASQTSQPLDNVQIKFDGRVSGKSFHRFLITSADGTATFEWPAGAKFENLRFTARAPKFVPSNYNWQGDQSQPEIPSHLDLRLDPGHEMGGIARDESGRPIAGVHLEIHMPITWPHRANWVFSAASKTTDDKGRWSWTEAPADCSSVSIQIRHPDYLPQWAQGSRSGDMLFILKRGLEVTGRVVDQNGKPVAGAAARLGFDRFGTNEPETKTDGHGRFTLKNCKPGRSLVTMQVDGLSPTFQEVVVGEAKKDLEFRLEPGHTLKVRIVDMHGKPITGAWMAPDTWRGYRTLDYRAKADAKGETVWHSAPADTMLCDFFLQGYMSARRVPLKASDEFQVVTMPSELVISGRVTDASTGEPIKSFHVRSGVIFSGNDRVYWPGDEGLPYENGRYSHKLSEPQLGTVLEVTAAGYLPAKSRTYASTEGAQTFDCALEPGTGLHGVVVLADGRPAVGADVGLATDDGRATLSMGRFNRFQNHAEVVKTDARGRFEFLPRDSDQFLVIAVHDGGFAEATAADLAKGSPIRLRPWGRLKGRVREGSKPQADCEVVFQPQSSIRPPGGMFIWDFGYTTRTDHEGRFEFDRVMPGPGTVSRVVVTEFGRSSQHAHGWGVPVEIPERATTDATIGGTGRPVIGKVRLDRKADIPIVWTTNEPATVTTWDKKTGRAAQPFRRYLGHILASGEFRIPDVPEGDYQLDVPVNNPPIPNACGAGRGEREFTVPYLPGGQSDEPLDLGEVTAKLFHTLSPGETAPDFVVQGLGGGSVRMSDFRGKLVLVNFWATWCAPCVAEIPQLKAVHDRFGKNLRFAQLSLSCDADLDTPKRFVENQAGLNWVQARVGDMTSRVASQYTVRAIPATFLIGPDGRVLAKNLKKDELEAAISAALADEKLFAAVTPGRPVRFPVTRATYAPEPSKLAAAPAVLVLSTVDASFEKNRPHDDHLRLLSASGSELWSHGGLTRTQDVGGAHCVAVDPARKRIYVCENLADRITAFNLGGQKLWQIDEVPARMLAIDEATGNLWTSGGGRLNEGETVVFDPQGREVLAIPYRALDIAYNPHDDAFWIAGYDMLKLNRKGEVLFKKHVDGWCYASVSPNPTNGTVWIAERDHPDIASSKNRLWQLNADGSVRRKIELDKYEISVVRCAPKTGDAWIAAYGDKLRRVPVVGEPGPTLPIEAKSISISPTSGEIWVTTKEAVLRLDPTGQVLLKTPFDKPILQSWVQAF